MTAPEPVAVELTRRADPNFFVDWTAERAQYETPQPGQCETCQGPHPSYEHPWIFTFNTDNVHPDTGEPLLWCYAVIVGTESSAPQQAQRLFGLHGFGLRYPSREAAGVERYGLTEVALPQRKDTTT